MNETVGRLGERALIERLAAMLPSRADVVVGVGDDTAVVRGGGGMDLLLTSDPVVEGTHFLPDTPPALAGRKAVGRSLSDLAAMGGTPLWALIDLIAPADTPVERVVGLYEGASAMAGDHDLAIVGGDTSEGEALELHVFAVGQAPQGTALLRSGGQAGEMLYVTGRLGGSLAGRHLTFDPRLREGSWLREGHWARAMIDLSDGLATDLRHLLDASRVGADIDLGALPVAPEAEQARDDRSPIEHALSDGEDFELLFTVQAERGADFEASWRREFELSCTAIGRTTPDPGILRARQEDGQWITLTGGGYEHFAKEAGSHLDMRH